MLVQFGSLTENDVFTYRGTLCIKLTGCRAVSRLGGFNLSADTVVYVVSHAR